MNKLKYTTRPSFLFILLTFSVLISCIKEEINLDNVSNEATINGTIKLPVLYAELEMDDLMKAFDSVAVVKFYPEDSFLYIQYKTDIVSKKAEDFINLSNQKFEEIIKSDYPGFPVTLPATFSNTIPKKFDVTNKEQIDSLIFKSGTLTLNVKSTFRNTGRIIFTVPNLTKNGKPLKDTVLITIADGTFDQTKPSIDLNGYKLIATQNGDTNMVKINYEVTLQAGSPIISSYAITITANITTPKFFELYGYLGQRELMNDKGTLSMRVFDVKDNSKVVFADPHLKFFSRNTFGVPLDVEIDTLYTYSILNKNYFTLDLDNPKPTVHQAPSLSSTAYDTTHIDKENSNIEQAMETVPRDLHYAVKATMNPSGKPRNFVTNESRLDADMDIELPLEMKLDRYDVSTEEMDFDISDNMDDLSSIDSVVIFSKFENWFPFEASCQFYFLDSLGNRVDSLFSAQPLLKAADIAASGPRKGRVINAQPYEVKVLYQNERIMALKDVRKAIFTASLYTKGYAQNAFVKFYLSDKLKVSLGAKASGKKVIN